MPLDARITIRLSTKEKEILQQKADDLNLKLNKFARLKLIHIPVDLTNTIAPVNLEYCKKLYEIDFQLGKIGTNINQLAHNANLSMQMGSPMQEEIKKLNEMSAYIEEMRGLIKNTSNELMSKAKTSPL
jgi:hypothetical protein